MSRAQATPSSRVQHALSALRPAELADLERRILASSRDRELTYTRDNGKTVVIRLLTTPVVLPRATVRYVQRLCTLLGGVFMKTAAARMRDPAVQALLPLVPGEAEWLALAPLGAAPLVARWDLDIDPAAPPSAIRLFEVNGCAVGGIHYGPASSDVLHEHVAPLSGARLAVPAALRDLWLGLLQGQARARRRPGCRIGWLEDRTWETGITEGPSLAAQLTRAGTGAVVCDPRELELSRGELTCRGERLDILYRSIELRDLLALEAEHGKLTALREAVARGLVLSPPEGDLDHKSLLEIWSSPRFARLFDARERRALAAHVPWTRALHERTTEGPTGAPVNLAAFTRKRRARLVIKPTRACGGDGVLIGFETSARVWERALAAALADPGSAVVQDLVTAAKITTPVATGKRGARPGRRTEAHYTNFGAIATPAGVGFLGRAAPFPVVNVARGGGLLGVLVG